MSIYGGGILNISYVICSLVSTPVKSYFGRFFVYNFFRRPTASKRLVSKDMEFSCASFDPYKKFAKVCPPTQTPKQKVKIEFAMFGSQGIVSRLVSFKMIFETLQSQLIRFKFHSLGSKLQKIPEFNLFMSENSLLERGQMPSPQKWYQM